jgi:hypothetical protein
MENRKCDIYVHMRKFILYRITYCFSQNGEHFILMQRGRHKCNKCQLLAKLSEPHLLLFYIIEVYQNL